MAVLRELVTRLRFSLSPRDRAVARQYDRTIDNTRRRAGALTATNASLAASNVSLAASFAGASRALAGFGAVFGTAFTGKAILDAGNNLDALDNRIRAVEGAAANIKRVRSDLTDLSFDNFAGLEDTAQIFQRFRIGTEDLGKSRAEILDFTDLVQKTAITSGGSPTETNAALIQFSQGISSNRFSGEEFRSVAEQLPTILRVLKRDLGLSTGELREQAFAGNLTADVIFGAFDRQRANIEEEFGRIQITRDIGLSQFRTGFTAFFGAFTRSSRINQDFAQLFSAVGRFFKDNTDLARNLGQAYYDAFVFAGDGIASLFGGSGGFFGGIGRTLAGLGAYLEQFRSALRAYTVLREDFQVGRSEAFNRAFGAVFGPEGTEKLRSFLQALEPVAKGIGVLFASRFAIAALKLARSMTPVGAAFLAVSQILPRLTSNGSATRQLFDKLIEVGVRLTPVFMKLGERIIPIITTAIDKLADIIEFMAARTLDLINLVESISGATFRAAGRLTGSSRGAPARPVRRRQTNGEFVESAVGAGRSAAGSVSQTTNSVTLNVRPEEVGAVISGLGNDPSSAAIRSALQNASGAE